MFKKLLIATIASVVSGLGLCCIGMEAGRASGSWQLRAKVSRKG